jgi:hypothetical protein
MFLACFAENVDDSIVINLAQAYNLPDRSNIEAYKTALWNAFVTEDCIGMYGIQPEYNNTIYSFRYRN